MPIDFSGFLSLITEIDSWLKFLVFIVFLFFVFHILNKKYLIDRIHSLFESLHEKLPKNKTFDILKVYSRSILIFSVVFISLVAYQIAVGSKEKPSVILKDNGVQLFVKGDVYTINGITFSPDDLDKYSTTITKGLVKFKKEKDYNSALDIFTKLEKKPLEKNSSDGVGGLITASYYGAEEHYKGVEKLCIKYNNGTHRDQTSFLFDMHAHLRAISKKYGYSNCIKFITLMRKKYGNIPELSHVWAGIPLGKMEDLHSGYIKSDGKFGNHSISNSDVIYLTSVINNYPDDDYLDFANYFLGQYANVYEIENSKILKFAMIMDIKTDNNPETACEKFILFKQEFPRSRYIQRLNSHIIYKLSSELEMRLFFKYFVKDNNLNKDYYTKFVKLINYDTQDIGKNQVRLLSYWNDDIYERSKYSDSDETYSDYEKRKYLINKIKLLIELSEFNGFKAEELGKTKATLAFLFGEFRKTEEFINFFNEKHDRDYFSRSFFVGYKRHLKSLEEPKLLVNELLELSKKFKKSLIPDLYLKYTSVVCAYNGETELVQQLVDIYPERKDLIIESYIAKLHKYIEKQNDKAIITNFIADLSFLPTSYIKGSKITKIIAKRLISEYNLKDFIKVAKIYLIDDKNFVIREFNNNFKSLMLEIGYDEIVKNLRTEKFLFVLSEIYDVDEFFDILKLKQALELLSLGRCNFEFSDWIWVTSYNNGKPYLDVCDFKKALSIYSNDRNLFIKFKIEIPAPLTEIIEDIQKINALKLSNNSNELLNSAIFLRDDKWSEQTRRARFTKAIQILDKILEGHENTIDAQKALYLKASFYRRLRENYKSLQLFMEFTNRYPKSHLIDDVYAEIGLHYLLVEKDLFHAKYYFEIVYKDYYDKNASDNALNWLGWYYNNKGDYKRALLYYGKVAAAYSNNRLGKMAERLIDHVYPKVYNKPRLRKLQGLKELSVVENKLTVIRTENSHNCADDCFNNGDILIRLNGMKIRNVEEFLMMLTEFHHKGEEVDVAVDRRGEVKIIKAVVDYDG